MAVNYAQAARRHSSDADLLDQEKRAENADQLYGLAAECALKAVLVGCGVPTAADGRIDRPYGVEHVDRLWPEYRMFMSGRQGARYLAPLLEWTSPFDDWSIEQRYDDAIRAAAIHAHRRAARACITVLARAVEDGNVP